MRRLRYAVAALVLAVGLVTVTGWSPLCVLYTPSDPMYWVLFCWVDPPPPSPDGFLGT